MSGTHALECKLVVTGPMGAGKTTAIAALSDVAPVSTDVANNDLAAFDKATTTVALDYGQVQLDDGLVVRLYGTPGQDRFDFMRRIVCEGALGVIVLLDASRATLIDELDDYIEMLQGLAPLPEIVVGVGRSEAADVPALAQVASRLEERGLVVPVFAVDVRRRRDVLLLVETLVCLLEAAEVEA